MARMADGARARLPAGAAYGAVGAILGAALHGAVSPGPAARRGRTRADVALMDELGAAVVRDELTLYYQPQVELSSGDVVGAEALVRWDHPRRGLLPPAEFIPVMERSGMVRPVTVHLLDRAVAECATWPAGVPGAAVAVNLPVSLLRDRQLPVEVSAALDRHNLPAHRLILEITETTMLADIDVVAAVLAELRGIGVRVSVDDFGTGYSSLALLSRLAVNEIKIDCSFVGAMLESASDAAIVRALVQLGRTLGLRTVAEGVENESLRAALATSECDVAQGYLFGRPMPAADLRTLLAAPIGPRVVPLPAQRGGALDPGSRSPGAALQ